jgi:hypothetical protein
MMMATARLRVSEAQGSDGHGERTVLLVGHDQLVPFAQDGTALRRGGAKEELLLRLVRACDCFFEVI